MTREEAGNMSSLFICVFLLGIILVLFYMELL